MSNTTLCPVLKQRFFDSNGVPLSGGLIYSYIAGTSTPQATYTDETGVTPNSNPVVLDSTGSAEIWITSGSYKFVVQDSLGNTQFTVDNVSEPTPATGSGTVTSVNVSVPAFMSISGNPVTTTGTLAFGLSGTALPVANGGTGSTSLVTAATASSVMGRDANANTQANNLIENFATTATAAGTTTLSVSSAYNQQFTGSTTQTVVLPDATTLVVGQQFAILNRSTGAVTVNNHGASLVATVGASTQAYITCTSIGSSNGTWDVSSSASGGGGSGTVTTVSVASANGFTGTVANATSTPAITMATSVTGVLKGNGTAISAATSGTDYSAGTSGLSTGIVKSTTSTGALTIAVAADFPTLNQNTSGTAAGLSSTLPVTSGGTGLTSLTSGSVVVGAGTSNPTLVAPSTSGNVLTSNGSTWISSAATGGGSGTGTFTATLGITIDGGGSAPTTGVKGYLYVPFACTINSVTLAADQSGSAVIDIWKVAYASFPPTVTNTITASDLPTLSSAQDYQDSTLTGWTTSVNAGDVLAFNVNSASTLTRINLVLKVTRSAPASAPLFPISVQSGSSFTIGSTSSGTTYCSSNAGTTATLPLAASAGAGFVVTMTKTHATDVTHANTLTCAGSDTINAGFQNTALTSFGLWTPGESITVTSDGTSVWYVTNRVTNTAWSTAVATTWTGTTTNPTKPTSMVKDAIQWRRDGANAEIWVQFKYTSSSGSSNGTGDYILAMPSGITFASSVSTYSTLIGSGSPAAAYDVYPGGMAMGSSSDAIFAIPYSTTSIKIYTANGGGSAFGSGFYGFNNSAESFSLKFQVPIANWMP
jgi:hypothetical protein